MDVVRADGSSQHHIQGIRTPSLFLVSRDDAFLGLLPVAECMANPHTALAVTQYGGHVAWLEGTLRPLQFVPMSQSSRPGGPEKLAENG